jgi:hypothetical protein
MGSIWANVCEKIAAANAANTIERVFFIGMEYYDYFNLDFA